MVIGGSSVYSPFQILRQKLSLDKRQGTSISCNEKISLYTYLSVTLVVLGIIFVSSQQLHPESYKISVEPKPNPKQTRLNPKPKIKENTSYFNAIMENIL